MGIFYSSNDNEAKSTKVKPGEPLPEVIDTKDLNFANIHTDEGDITYYNPIILNNPKNIVMMIQIFKQEIELLEYMIEEMGVEEMYNKKMKDFDSEAMVNQVKEEGKLQGQDIEKYL